jgi:MYXO-CTERM domain-containing protein
MEVMQKFTAVIIATALLGLSQANDAYACSCVPPPPVATAVGESSAVFAGTIVALTPPSLPSNDMVATFSVERVWKGATNQTAIEVRTPSSSAACGLSFAPGQKWLIYANESEGGLSAILCSRSTLYSNAQADLAELGAGTTPGTQPQPVPPGQRGCACEMAPVGSLPWGAVAALGAAGVLVARRRRRTAAH